MKKTKRKIVFLTAMVVSIILIATSYNDNSSFSSGIVAPEALAASENGDFDCSDGEGFCLINSVVHIGVTYKE